MNANEYQQLAKRTMANQDVVGQRIEAIRNGDWTFSGKVAHPIQVLHSVTGLAGEVGELAGAVERWLWYNQQLDVANIKEELGDCFWYIAELCNALGFSMEQVMEANIAKLRKRFPDKYSDDLAKEENRNRVEEMDAVKEQTGQGWSEPKEDVVSNLPLPITPPDFEYHKPVKLKCSYCSSLFFQDAYHLMSSVCRVCNNGRLEIVTNA